MCAPVLASRPDGRTPSITRPWQAGRELVWAAFFPDWSSRRLQWRRGGRRLDSNALSVGNGKPRPWTWRGFSFIHHGFDLHNARSGVVVQSNPAANALLTFCNSFFRPSRPFSRPKPDLLVAPEWHFDAAGKILVECKPVRPSITRGQLMGL